MNRPALRLWLHFRAREARHLFQEGRITTETLQRVQTDDQLGRYSSPLVLIDGTVTADDVAFRKLSC